MRLRVSFVILFIYPLHLWSFFLFTTLYSFAFYLTISLLQLHSFSLKFHISLFTPFSCFLFFPPVSFPLYPLFLLILIFFFPYHFHILPKFFFNLPTCIYLTFQLFFLSCLLYIAFIPMFMSSLLFFYLSLIPYSFPCYHFCAVIFMLSFLC